ncbi:thiamine phosphate synthase [Rhodovarius crocodyli]|uniref:thiamine phosphate synthase n=1 Tax=Rhodovarius crocodyli TaxID=1979269 RepID=UPI001F0BE1D3|nr:thiamine phosphate synthase [Rhodovarius crocodyli]
MPRLWLLSDPARLPDPRAAALRLPRGSAVLARGVAPALLPGLALLCRQRGLRLLVGGDARAALALGAGLHVPERGAPGLAAFLLARRPGALLSVAVHGRAGLARARRLGADAVLISPVFPTRSHPGAPALGLHAWAWMARHAARPAVALGGVDARSARRLPRIARGFAAISWFL